MRLRSLIVAVLSALLHPNSEQMRTKSKQSENIFFIMRFFIKMLLIFDSGPVLQKTAYFTLLHSTINEKGGLLFCYKKGVI